MGSRGIALLILDLGARRGGWSTPRPGRFTPRKDPVPIIQEAGWAPGPLWTCAKNLAPTGIFFVCTIVDIFYLIDLLVVRVTNMGQIILLSFRRKACCEFSQPEKSDGFGREPTRDLGYQRPAC
jgi:hypothetical protein